jgi:hypothetical protein
MESTATSWSAVGKAIVAGKMASETKLVSGTEVTTFTTAGFFALGSSRQQPDLQLSAAATPCSLAPLCPHECPAWQQPRVAPAWASQQAAGVVEFLAAQEAQPSVTFPRCTPPVQRQA